MKKKYIAPHMEIIEIEIESLIMNASLRYNGASTNSDDGQMNISYDGISHVGIGDGGFLNSK